MIGLSAYEIALRYSRSHPHSVIKLKLPNNKFISIAQDKEEQHPICVQGTIQEGTVEVWDGENQHGYLNGVALANYILKMAKE